MSSRPTPRPRFRLVTALPPTAVRDRVQRFLRTDRRVRGIAFEHRIEMGISAGDSHFYSPQLVVTVEPTPGGGSSLSARFGPDAYIWAFYVLGTGLLCVVTVFALIIGAVQWSLGQAPVAFFVAPAAALVAGLVYGASFVGQGLGYEQMHFLRSSLTELVEAEEAPKREVG